MMLREGNSSLTVPEAARCRPHRGETDQELGVSKMPQSAGEKSFFVNHIVGRCRYRLEGFIF